MHLDHLFQFTVTMTPVEMTSSSLSVQVTSQLSKNGGTDDYQPTSSLANGAIGPASSAHFSGVLIFVLVIVPTSPIESSPSCTVESAL